MRETAKQVRGYLLTLTKKGMAFDSRITTEWFHGQRHAPPAELSFRPETYSTVLYCSSIAV